MANQVSNIRAWRNHDGKLLSDKELRQISKSWDAEMWEQYLVAIVDVDRAEDEMSVADFETLLEESSEGLWEGPLHVPDPVKKVVSQALRLLTKKQTHIIWLTYWCEYSQPEIARRLKISHQAACSTKIISLNKIKDFLANDVAVSSYLIGGSKNFDPKPRNQHEQILEIYFQDLKGSYLK